MHCNEDNFRANSPKQRKIRRRLIKCLKFSEKINRNINPPVRNVAIRLDYVVDHQTSLARNGGKENR